MSKRSGSSLKWTPTDGDGLEVDEVGHLLVVVDAPLLALVEADADEVWVHELGAHAPKDLVLPVLHERQLARVEDHADILVIEVELLVPSRGLPWYLKFNVNINLLFFG